jgi:FixJ family two-component response regulator
MTGLATSRIRDEAMKRGCSGYIEKPFELKEIFCAIARWLPVPQAEWPQSRPSPG